MTDWDTDTLLQRADVWAQIRSLSMRFDMALTEKLVQKRGPKQEIPYPPQIEQILRRMRGLGRSIGWHAEEMGDGGAPVVWEFVDAATTFLREPMMDLAVLYGPDYALNQGEDDGAG